MSARRTRAASQRDESSEPQEGPVTRRTRRGSKRAEAPVISPQSDSAHHRQSGIPQRGTRRRRGRSAESIAKIDSPKSSAEHASPDDPLVQTPGPIDVEETVTPNTGNQSDSYEDKAARLQDILDFDLPKLHRWCGNTYEALSSLTHPEPTARERKNLNMAKKSFKLACLPFAEDGAPYIDPTSFDLPYPNNSGAYAAVHKTMRSANLISLLLSLVDLKHTQWAGLSFLQELDNAFATCLDSVLPLEPRRQDLAFRVRCRRLLELLGKEPDTPPLVLAAKTFCIKPAEESEEAEQQLRKGPFRKFGGIEQGGDLTASERFRTQMDEIIAQLSSPERAETEDFLNATFPWNKLLEDLWGWALESYVLMDRGPDDKDPSPDEEREELEGLPPGADNGAEEDLESDSSSEHEEYQKLELPAKEPIFIRDPAMLAAVRRREEDGSGHPTSSSLQSTKKRLTASQIKDGINQLDPARVLGPPNPGPRSSSRDLGDARTITHSQEDGGYVDDDGDFEVNEQLRDETRRIHYDEGPEVIRPRAKRHRLEVNSSNRGGGPPLPDNPPTSSNIREADIHTLMQVGRANRLANKVKDKQNRDRWNDADTDRLLDMIADPKLGCSWAAMERKGGFQTYRTQQAIRDKARNLKKGYLCADATLPSGFDNVYLGRKERDDVIASGHNPDRMEDDIDEHGRVIRNWWND